MISSSGLLKEKKVEESNKNRISKPAPTESRGNEGSIANHFTQFLQPRIAVTQALKEEAFKIRHSVYCEELAFEKINKSGQEIDEFDQRSQFALIQHKSSENFTSCVRLVTSNHQNELLPIEKFCANSITDKALHPQQFKRSEIGEISRLAVLSNYRRRKADKFQGSAIGNLYKKSFSDKEIRCFPFITMGLYMAVAIMSMRSNIHHIYVMMEPRLARSVRLLGIYFHQLGPVIDYHGLRAPYYIQPKDFTKNLSKDFKALFKAIEKDIHLQLNVLDLSYK